MLNEQQLGEYIDEHFTSTLFRLECRAHYDLRHEDEDFRRYLAGQPGPTSTWPEVIRSEVGRGLNTYRVHVVQSPLTDYLRYECEWAYTANASAGEHIRILDTSEQHKPASVGVEDFWLIGDEHLLVMHYSTDGEFVGASIGDERALPRYIAAREAAWSAATDFTDYWHRHPQYHRDRLVA